MKLKEIKKEEWGELAHYVDTVLVPLLPLYSVTDIVGIDHLNKIEQVAVTLEEGLRGRILLWPTCTYSEASETALLQMENEWKQKGFKYVCFIGSQSTIHDQLCFLHVDVTQDSFDISLFIQQMITWWHK